MNQLPQKDQRQTRKPTSPLGRLGEQKALEYLQQKKRVKFIDRNFHTRWGELDLIVETPDGTILFVEVKSRIVSSFGSPLEQIDKTKLRHLVKAIEIYLNLKDWQQRRCRLDAIGIEFTLENPDDQPEVANIEYVEDLTGW